MLKQNTTILAQYPFRGIGGLFSGERSMWDRAERRNKFIGEAGWDKKCGVPSGHLAPSSWNLPQSDGGMASFTGLKGAGSTAAGGAMGVNAEAAVSGAGDIFSADAELVVSMVATLAGAGTVAAADLRGYLNAVANLTGSGSVAAAIGAIAWATSAVTGAGTISNATPYATGSLGANILSYSSLTPEGIRDAIWNAVAANHTTVGTMGQKLNSAASGGVDYAALGLAVWNVLAGDANAIGTVGALLNAAATLDKQQEILTKLDNVSVASGSLNASAIGFTLTAGTVVTGSYTDVRTLDGVYHQINDAGGVIDMEYLFNIGRDAYPSGVTVAADLRNKGDNLGVFAWNWTASAWEQIGTRVGDNNSAISVNEFVLLQAHVGSGANVGNVRIRYYGTGLTSANFIVDRIFVTFAVVSRRVGYVGQVVSAAGATLVLGSDASAVDDYYRPALAVIVSGTGRDQYRRVDGYTGSTRTLTLATPWSVMPDSSSVVELHPWGSVRVSEMDAGPVGAISDDVAAKLNASTIPVDIRKVRGQSIGGTGIEADPWRPV